MDPAVRAGLIEVALGLRPADVYIEKGLILNVYSGEVMEGQGIAIWRDRIAYVGASRRMVGEHTRVIDAGGRYLAPGYIDPHGHSDILYNPRTLADAVLPLGTTTILSDTHDIAGALGSRGIRLLIESSRGARVRYRFAAGWVSPPRPEFDGDDILPAEEWEPLLAEPEVASLSETTFWPRLVARESEALRRLCLGLERFGKIEGHTSGCSGEKLNALVAAGITSCHESINASDVENRLRLGLWTMLRHGSIRSDMEALAALFTGRPGLDTSRVMFTPDWMSPEHIEEWGYIDHIVSAAIGYGIPPIRAYQMATRNPATYMGMDNLIGGIAPGRYADILFLDALEQPRPRTVMSGGRLVAEDGRLLIPPSEPLAPVCAEDWPAHRLHRGDITPELFRVPSRSTTAVAESVPCISVVDKTITRLVRRELPVRRGYLEAYPERDVLKVSILSRDNEGFVTGFVEGMGARVGGMASSMAHEHHKPMVIGFNEADMCLAMRRLFEMGGGVVIAHGGAVVAELPLNVGGMLSTLPVAELARGTRRVKECLKGLGCSLEDPIFTQGFLSFEGLPYARITPSGVLDVIKGEIVFP